MMNGEVSEPMDTTISDCALEEKKDDFEIGHVFVKGRRRSLRVMRCETPQRELPSSKVGNQEVLKEETNDSLELTDVQAEIMASPKYSGSAEKKKNSKMVINGLDVIQEGEKVFERESCVSEKMEVDASRDLFTSFPEVSDSSEGKLDRNTCIEKSWKLEEGVIGIALCSRQRKPVEKLLSVPVSSFILLPALRSKLPFHLALKLIRHLLWLLSSPEADDCPSDEKLVEWICHLLDAFYQQYTLSQDDDVLDTLQAVKKVLDFQVKLIEALKEMEPLLLQLKSGRIVKEKSSDKWYSIENVRLY
ncbi:hypothetical protein J437_LFUL008612 [Ladona fulva]|uniref:Nucleolar protein 11 C-terminal domain-containing protein n=1 Tax=Ladona fulva TaxID=123851 RepID=A0A8K0KB79_LADFU|nr:hypothetical protein J437_LFUL008612 [Ladona fulva]